MEIAINDLHYTYPTGVEALRGISLTFGPGEQVAIVGQNGAGKTTLVKHLNGLLRPGRGRVSVGDWDTTDHSVARLARRVGYVFQNPDEQLFSRTVGQEVAFGPRNLGFPAERVRHLVDEALDLTGLGDQAEVNPYDLSPTWRKMVALASIVSMDTPVVILDEPTTGQDAPGIGRIARVIAALRGRGQTVLTITHDIDFCAEHFERVVALSQGRVLLDGPAGEVLGQEQVLATTYVDPPQLTRLGLRLGFGRAVRNEDEFLGELERRDSGRSDAP